MSKDLNLSDFRVNALFTCGNRNTNVNNIDQACYPRFKIRAPLRLKIWGLYPDALDLEAF